MPDMPYVVKNKIAFLSEASKILSSSLDYNVTLAILAKLVTDNVADFCIIDVYERSELVRLVVRVSDPKKQQLAQKFSKFKPHPKNKRAIYETARLGKSILIKKVTESWLKTVTRVNEERQTVHDLHLKSMIFAPLKSRSDVIGVLTIGSSKKGFSYSHEDSLFIDELAVRAGTAVDKAKLFKEAQEAIKLRDEFVS